MNNHSNIAKFFSDENRSMMGGWTAPAMEAAKAKANSLAGVERDGALADIEARINREQEA